MFVKRPPMGWNSWNTFGENISEDLILEMAKAMKEKGYLAKGYEYVVIDDCWSLKERDEQGRLMADPKKFPRGMKALACDLHEMGFRFGMYSCAGVLTCAGYPGSYDHEFIDAQTFADWGVDYLKYDFCNFPASADGKARYAMMSMALKASGRDILFAACNWGTDDPWKWMGSLGVHMYRSTGDIQDNFVSFTDIAKSQLENLCMSGSPCFNDLDMLTVGMFGKGNVALGKAPTLDEYALQFGLWCFLGSPLMLGGDLRTLSEECRELLLNDRLLRINQDEEGRAPQVIYRDRMIHVEEGKWEEFPDTGLVLFRHLGDGLFALGLFNLSPKSGDLSFIFADAGLPYESKVGLRLSDAFTGEEMGLCRDYLTLPLAPHTGRIFLGSLERAAL